MKFIEPYNPKWATAFEELKAFFAAELFLLRPGIDIQHVGSTAIPGMISKAILDIDIIIEDTSQLESLDLKLQQIGYEPKGDQGIPGRFAYRQSSRFTPLSPLKRSWQPHHLYVCFAGSLALKNHLLFRDMLRNNPDLVKRYNELKIALTHNMIIVNLEYTNKKTDFILTVLAEAGLSPEEILEIKKQTPDNIDFSYCFV